MKNIVCGFLALVGLGALALAGSCPDVCGNVCGTEKSCCPAKKQGCGSVQLERAGNSASAYSSKGAPRLK